MLTITCQQMKDIDNYTINDIKIPSIILMEYAALKVIVNIDLKNTDTFTIVCGTGNNGGDGLAIARHLILKGKKVDLYIVGNLEKASTDFNINLNILKNINVDFIQLTDETSTKQLKKSSIDNDLTIDAIFGIGLSGNIEGLFYKVINTINKHSKNILAVDLPSGIDGDTGQVLGIATKANKTVTFHLMKQGLLKNADYADTVVVEDIGIPNQATNFIIK